MARGIGLELNGVTVYIGAVRVLNGISLELEPGESLAVIGRNGAGKTTLVRTIMGIVKPDKGRISFTVDGRSIDAQDMKPHEIATLGVGYVPQGRLIFPDLTAMENLEVAYGGPVPGDIMDWIYTILPELKRFIDRKGRYLSGGEQQILAVARALVKKPRMIILDEPLEGLAPKVVKSILAALGEIKSEGVQILITESGIPKRVKSIADKAIGLDRGEIVYQGSIDGIEEDPTARRRIWGL
ncbi:MAG: ABC transporter ATP-binding protein [Desulfurococcales archaeon]|nr:ABC transporter ATP-binding protein [Desulfurococcales archaeon]